MITKFRRYSWPFLVFILCFSLWQAKSFFDAADVKALESNARLLPFAFLVALFPLGGLALWLLVCHTIPWSSQTWWVRDGIWKGILAIYFALVVILLAYTSVNGFGSTSSSFEELPGGSAKLRLADAWPPRVDPRTVESVSYRANSAFDKVSSWLRIKLDPQTAKVWADHVHLKQEQDAKQRVLFSANTLEGVHRFVAGPPPPHRQTGATPSWWIPPSIEFYATEAMLWYSNQDSGIPYSTYSTFDEATSVLWIYSCSVQHDKLWKRGEMPDGDKFIINNPGNQ